MRFSGHYVSMLCLLVTGTLAIASFIKDETYGIRGPHGIDTGNSICMGQCTANKKELPCAEPVVSLSFFFLNVLPI